MGNYCFSELDNFKESSMNNDQIEIEYVKEIINELTGKVDNLRDVDMMNYVNIAIEIKKSIDTYKELIRKYEENLTVQKYLKLTSELNTNLEKINEIKSKIKKQPKTNLINSYNSLMTQLKETNIAQIEETSKFDDTNTFAETGQFEDTHKLKESKNFEESYRFEETTDLSPSKANKSFKSEQTRNLNLKYEFFMLSMFKEILEKLEENGPISASCYLNSINLTDPATMDVYLTFLDYDLIYPKSLLTYNQFLMQCQSKLKRRSTFYTVESVECIKFLSCLRDLVELIIERGNIMMSIELYKEQNLTQIQDYIAQKLFVEEYIQLFFKYQLLVHNIKFSDVDL